MATTGGTARPERPRLTLCPPRLFPITFARLWEHEVHQLSPWVRTIEPDHIHGAFGQRRLTLPLVFLGTEHWFGRGAGAFDTYKSSFGCPLLLTARGHGRELRYLAQLGDCRGAVRLHLFRFQKTRSKGMDPYLKPDPTELSRTEINLLTDCVVEFLEGCGEILAKSVDDFYRVVPSELTVYGVRNGDVFLREYADADAFHDAMRLLERDFDDGERRRMELVLNEIER